MSDQPDNIVLQRLREIRGLLGDIKADTVEVKQRLGLLEGGYASVSARLDRVAGDVEQIKCRLELTEASAP